MNSAIKMVTAYGSIRWETTGVSMHKKEGFVSFSFNVDTGVHAVSFQEHQSVSGPFKLELPHVSMWEKPQVKKLFKESQVMDNCRLRSVLLSFKESVGLQRIQLSFAIETDANGVVTKDHGKVIQMAMQKAFLGLDEW